MKTLIAIDPGASGGIAWLRENEKACCVPMPATEGDLIAMIKKLSEPDVLKSPEEVAPIFYLENLVKHMGAGIPASTMAVYASNWGFLKGCIQMSGCPLHLVTPQKWQKGLGLGSRVRGASKTEWKNKLKSEAQRLYPHLEITLKTADALLILKHAELQERIL